MKNTHHCAHSLLPPVKSCIHYLRPKGHKYELPRCDLELYKIICASLPLSLYVTSVCVLYSFVFLYFTFITSIVIS